MFPNRNQVSTTYEALVEVGRMYRRCERADRTTRKEGWAYFLANARTRGAVVGHRGDNKGCLLPVQGDGACAGRKELLRPRAAPEDVELQLLPRQARRWGFPSSRSGSGGRDVKASPIGCRSGSGVSRGRRQHDGPKRHRERRRFARPSGPQRHSLECNGANPRRSSRASTTTGVSRAPGRHPRNNTS